MSFCCSAYQCKSIPFDLHLLECHFKMGIRVCQYSDLIGHISYQLTWIQKTSEKLVFSLGLFCIKIIGWSTEIIKGKQ